jgi:hypothetical protein
MSDVPNQAKIAAQKGNDVSWQDELRAALADSATTQTPDGRMLYLTDALIALHHIAAAHPGLVEVVQCGECMRLGRDVERGDDECSKAPLWCYELLFEPEDETFYCPHGHRKDTP